MGEGEDAKWHGRLANVIERQHPELRDDALFRLAHHTAEAAIQDEEVERPLHYALLAAGRAIESFAWKEVSVHSGHVLDWIEFTAPGPERDAREIEAVLLAHPEVADCAVFGIPSDDLGETLAAIVQPALTAGGSNLGAGDLREFMSGKLAGFKVPGLIAFRNDLPREDSGKIFKRKLREPYWEKAGRKI